MIFLIITTNINSTNFSNSEIHLINDENVDYFEFPMSIMDIEINNDFTSAELISPGYLNGSIGGIDDDDFYKIWLETGEFLEVEAYSYGFSYSFVDLFLYSTNTTESLVQFDDLNDEIFVYYTAQDSGYHYLRFFTEESIVGTYEADITIYGDISDDFEPDNSEENATLLTTEDFQSHSIFPIGDIDYYYIELNRSSTISIEIHGLSGDSLLYIYDSDTNLITYDDDSGVGYLSRISNYNLTGGIYFVVVTEYSDDYIITEYDISFEVNGYFIIDEYEPDDSFNQSTLLINGSQQIHNCKPTGDADYYYFELESNSFVNILSSINIKYFEIFVYDSNMTELSYDASDSFGYLIENLFLFEGLYYIKVQSYRNIHEIEQYQIMLSIVTTGFDIYEPDNDYTEAIYVKDGDRQSHSIFPLNDKDFYFFELLNPAVISIKTSFSNPDSTLVLQLEENRSYYFSEIETVYNYLDTFYLTEGKYFLSVYSLNEETIDSYNISIDIHELILTYDPFEPDNGFNQAKIIENNSIQTHTIFPTNDEDYYEFSLESPAYVTIELTGFNNYDTVLYLYDSSEQEIDYDDDSGEESFSLLKNIHLETGNYYLCVIEFGGDSTILYYNIKVSIVSTNISPSHSEFNPRKTTDSNGNYESSSFFFIPVFLTLIIFNLYKKKFNKGKKE